MGDTNNALQQPLLSVEDPSVSSSFNDEVAADAPNNEDNRDNTATPPSRHRRHRNIPVMLAFQFIRASGEALWVGSVLSSYVYLIKPQNPELIGYLSAIEGIVQRLGGQVSTRRLVLDFLDFWPCRRSLDCGCHDDACFLVSRRGLGVEWGV